jgi:alpha/beta superfamily hydrolase
MLAANTKDKKPEKIMDYDLILPSAKAPSPCVIICPGQGYHKDLPLVKDFAVLAGKNGFAALSFNWSYFASKGNPSEDGSKEIADLEAMINLAKHNPKIDSTRIYIAGKSMGSLFAYNAFVEHKELKGCILLTPLLSKAEEGNNYYPELATEKRPVAFILGDRDTTMCKLTELYKYLGTCNQNISVVALAGAHAIQIEGDQTNLTLQKINAEGIKLAVEAAVYRLKVMEYDNNKL